ncbi:hypothetical protein P8452_03531 [Trifolium repens]|nr:hypothetical protein P8452_03531 [Trifolium repens]
MITISSYWNLLFMLLLLNLGLNLDTGADQVSDHFTNFFARKHAVRALPKPLTKLGFQEPSCAQHSRVSIFSVTAYCSQWLMVKVMVYVMMTCVAYNFFLAGIS